MTFQKVRNYIKFNLSFKRAEHVFAVEQLMVGWAEACSLPPDDAVCAALGHDLARELPPEVLLWLAEMHRVSVEPWERRVPLLLHGKVAVLLLPRLGVEVGPAVKQAIEQHTLGAREMGKLSQLLYCADYLEPNRTHLSTEERAALLCLSLEEMFVAVVRQSSAYHQGRGELCPPSAELLESLCR